MSALVDKGPRKAPSRKQTEIPGTEREVDEEIEDAIGKLQKAKARRTKAKADVDDTTDALAALLESKSIEAYVSIEHERAVGLTSKRKLTFKRYQQKDATLEAAE